MTWSLVSWSAACSPSRTCPRRSVERIDATVGRQTAQPRPVPCAATISENVRSPSSRTMRYNAARDIAKCSHSASETVTPARDSSPFSSLVSAGTHDPHTVPAVVQSLTCPIVRQPCSVTAARTVPASTLLHEHTTASSGSSVSARPSPSGAITAAGSAPSGRPRSGRSAE